MTSPGKKDLGILIGNKCYISTGIMIIGTQANRNNVLKVASDV